MKKIHILLGMLNSGIKEPLMVGLKETGYDEIIIEQRNMKTSVLQYLIEHRDVNILLVQEAMESSNPYQMHEFGKLLDIIDQLMIIPILTNNTKEDKSKLLELYNFGIYNAVFDSDQVKLSSIIKLIENKRTRVEVRTYYGINDVTGSAEDKVDYAASARFIEFDNGQTLEERVSRIRKAVQEKDFRIIVSKLSKETISEMNQQNIAIDILEACGLRQIPNADEGTGESGTNRKSKKMILPEVTLSLSSQSVLVDYMSAIKKVVIGFTGSQEHIGATFQTIAFAYYLAQKKYKVAILEDNSQAESSLMYLGKARNVKSNNEQSFHLNGIDFFPAFDLSDISNVILKDYNFLLIDFGTFRPEILNEFNRCIVSVIVCGSLEWELNKMESIFSTVKDEDILMTYHYLFMPAENEKEKLIKKNMGSLEHVYFADLLRSPFQHNGFPAIEKIIGEYLPVSVTTAEKGDTVISKIKKLFE